MILHCIYYVFSINFFRKRPLWLRINLESPTLKQAEVGLRNSKIAMESVSKMCKGKLEQLTSDHCVIDSTKCFVRYWRNTQQMIYTIPTRRVYFGNFFEERRKKQMQPDITSFFSFKRWIGLLFLEIYLFFFIFYVSYENTLIIRYNSPFDIFCQDKLDITALSYNSLPI